MMEIEDGISEHYHSFLLLSKEGNTMVLETGEALQEITDRVGFYVTGSTLDAGNVLDRQRIVQVFSTGIRLLKGTDAVDEIQLKKEVRFSTIKDPFITLQYNDGSIGIYRSLLSKLEEVPFTISNGHGGVTACSMFLDENGVFAENSGVQKSQGLKSDPMVVSSQQPSEYDEMDEEERMLYGQSKSVSPEVSSL